MKNLLYVLICLIIGVEIFDIYCTVKAQDVLEYNEENPAALLFMSRKRTTIFLAMNEKENKAIEVPYDTYDVSALVLYKVVGLVLSILILQTVLSRFSIRMSAAVIVPVAFMMSGLLVFLLW